MQNTKFSIQEYTENLFNLCGFSDEYIKNRLKRLDQQVYKMYALYLTDQKADFKFVDGIMQKLDNFTYLCSKKSVVGNSAEFWFVTPDLTQFLLKENTKHNVMSSGSSYISENNYLIIPQLAKPFKIESALYYLVEFYDNDGEPNTYIVTPDFRKNSSDELIRGDSIVSKTIEEGSKGTLNINKMIHRIEKYLSNRRVDKNEIEQVKKDFIKQCFFYKFISNKDQTNENWSIIINNKNVKLAPIYDVDFCFGNNRKTNYERYIGDKKTDILSFIEEFKNLDWFLGWINESIINLDINKVFDDVYNETNYKIPNSIKAEYTKKINLKITEVQEAIKNINNNKNIQERG